MGEGAKVGDRPKQVSSDSHYVATLMLQGVAEGIAQLVRALAFGAKCCWFNSSYHRHEQPFTGFKCGVFRI